MSAVQTILLPTDFSESCEYAFELASTMARHLGSRLIVLHVDAMLEPVEACAACSAQHGPGDKEPTLWRNLRRFQTSAANVRVDPMLAEGDPATEILKAAREARADLIVMGLHGHTGLQRLLTRSVVTQVLRQASCPVWLVKIPYACCSYLLGVETCGQVRTLPERNTP